MGEEDYIFRATTDKENTSLDPYPPKTSIKRYAKLAGVRGKITGHSARSHIIEMLLENGPALERGADFVGLRDITMTKAINSRGGISPT